MMRNPPDKNIELLPNGATAEDVNRRTPRTRLKTKQVTLDPGAKEDFSGIDNDSTRRWRIIVTNCHATQRGYLMDPLCGERIMSLFPAARSEPLETDAPIRVYNPDTNSEAIEFEIVEIFYT
jgi:hypothetical protein